MAHRHQIEKVEEIEKLNRLLSEEVQEIKIKAEDKAIIQGFFIIRLEVITEWEFENDE